MCGIVGVVSKNEFRLEELLSSLKRLEYRGYDSFGFATKGGLVKKGVGDISTEFEGTTSVGIAHTRWATHGAPSKLNAHPHTDCSGRFFIVHNGIIDNYKKTKNQLKEKGHNFTTDTDSEVIAHYFEDKTGSIEDSIKDFFRDATGTFAILIIEKGSEKIYALKRGSPIAVGIGKEKIFIASDIYAFSDKTKNVFFLEDDEFGVFENNSYKIFDSSGKKIEKEIHKLDFEYERIEGNFEKHMIKEIHEEPFAVERLINSLQTIQKDKIEKLKKLINRSKSVIFVACGTSYHASLLGVYFLKKAGIECHAIIASEFQDFTFPDEESLVVALSQSGETMDVIDALKFAKSKDAKIASVVNVPYSTIQRMSDVSVEIMAGQEICVAATKTFVNQVSFFLYLAKEFGFDTDLERLKTDIKNIFKIEDDIKYIAKCLKDEKDIYIIGRGLLYPVAREIALKLKEISYIHAEGMMGGELKHGTIALIEKGTPVISLMNGDPDIISNTKEVEARGAKIISISNNGNGFEGININNENDGAFSILATTVGQLLTYYIAKEKGLPIDKPRNLAKSVTVR